MLPAVICRDLPRKTEFAARSMIMATFWSAASAEPTSNGARFYLYWRSHHGSIWKPAADPAIRRRHHEYRAMNQVEPLARIPVGVVVERRRAKSQWAHFVWRPVAVLAGVPEAEPWTVLNAQVDHTTYYAGAADVALYRSDCSNYHINLSAASPQLWVILRGTGAEPPYKVAAVTADPGEAEAFADSGVDLVNRYRCRNRSMRPLPPSSPCTIARMKYSPSASAIAPIRKRWRGVRR